MLAFRKVVIKNRSKCTYQGGFLVVRQDDKQFQIHLSEIDCLIIETLSIVLSSYLLIELSKENIAVIFCDDKHMPHSQLMPLYGSYAMNERIVEQIRCSKPIKKQVWKRIIEDKILLQAEVLNILKSPKEQLLRDIAKEIKSGDSTNRESVAARIYFPAIFGDEFTRGEDSDINASLDYGYQIILASVARNISARGYLTNLGIGHKSTLNQFNLASDFIEPFRVIVDLYVALNNDTPFNSNKKIGLISLLDKKVNYKDGQYRLSSVISGYVDDCLAALRKDIKIQDIERFMLI